MEEKIYNRFAEFMYLCFNGSRTEYSRALGYKNRQAITDYLEGFSLPGNKMLQRFENAGGNPEWLRAGNGSPFADNEAGRRLKMKAEGAQAYAALSDNSIRISETTPLNPRPASVHDEEIERLKQENSVLVEQVKSLEAQVQILQDTIKLISKSDVPERVNLQGKKAPVERISVEEAMEAANSGANAA